MCTFSLPLHSSMDEYTLASPNIKAIRHSEKGLPVYSLLICRAGNWIFTCKPIHVSVCT